MLISYARVSTRDRNLELQREALTKAGCQMVFEDKVSGPRADRLMESSVPRHGGEGGAHSGFMAKDCFTPRHGGIVGAEARSESRLELHDIMQRGVGSIEKLADATGGLPDALLVFDQGEAHIIIAMLAKANAGRHRDI